MGRSYRRPLAAITGLASAKSDKQMAHRGVRRKQNLALRICLDYDSLILPHRLECRWNDTYNWGRDGAQCYLAWMRDSPQEDFRLHYRKLLPK